MKLTNPVKFLIFFCLSYFVIIGLHEIKAVRAAHNNFFIATEQVVFNMFNPNIRIDLKQYEETPGVPYYPDSYDHAFVIYDKKKYNNTPNKRRAQATSMLNASLDNSSIGPVVLFLALLIATPVLWWRKIIYAIIGIILIYILIALKYSYMFSTNISTIPSTGIWGFLSDTFGDAFRSHEFLLLNVALIWAIVSIRAKELKWFLS
jgi:hypothetical protein